MRNASWTVEGGFVCEADGSCGLGWRVRVRAAPLLCPLPPWAGHPFGPFICPFLFQGSTFLNRSCISKGEIKYVDFEWKANGWFFHLKLILSLSSILIVNWWKLLLSVVNGKRYERKKGIIVFSLSCLFLDSSVLSSIKHKSQIKMLVCSECIQLFQMSNT